MTRPRTSLCQELWDLSLLTPQLRQPLRHILHSQGYPVPQFPFTDCSLFLNSASLWLFPASFPHFSSHVSKSTTSMNHLHGSPCSNHCSVSEALRTQSNFIVITGAVLYKLPTVKTHGVHVRYGDFFFFFNAWKPITVSMTNKTQKDMWGGVHQFPCKREGGIFRMERTADGVRLLKSLPSINKALGSIPTAWNGPGSL